MSKTEQDRQQLFDQHDKKIQSCENAIRELRELYNAQTQRILKMDKKIGRNENYIQILRG